MQERKRGLSLIALLSLGLISASPPAPAAAAAPTAAVEEKKSEALSLEDCIVQAVKANLGVAIQVLSYRQSDSALSQANEKYLPTLSLGFDRQQTNSASFSWIQSADVLSSKYQSLTAGISQQIPFGGLFSISLDSYRNESNTRFQTINPYYQGSLSFSFNQPLLKDFGWRTSRREILVARNNRDIAENDLKALLLGTVSAVEKAYWELVYEIEILKVGRQSLQLAEDLLDKSRKEAEIGTLAPKEIISAQAEVASRKADILQAEMMVKDSMDVLRGLLNLPLESDAVEIAPADTPFFAKSETGLDEALALALKNRPDLRSSELEVKNKELDFAFAKNQTLPALNLKAQYWSPGLSGDRILYLDDNPFSGVVVGKVPGGASLALQDALNFRYQNWSIGLSLDIPLSSILTRAAQAQAKAGLDQEIVQMKQTEQRAVLEIRAAVRAVQTNFERVNARREARALAEQKLAAEEAKLQVGLSNNFYVLNYQRDLAAAKTAELRALIDYTLSLGQLDKATGTSLDKRNIRLADAGEVK